jgi:hypothetical protein
MTPSGRCPVCGSKVVLADVETYALPIAGKSTTIDEGEPT